MHKEFAEIYDIFMKHVNYDEWYKFLKMFIKNIMKEKAQR